MKTLILDNENWQLGSSTDDATDFPGGIAGFSPDWKGQNMFRSKGDSLVGQPTLVACTGATLGGELIAGLVDPTTTSRDALVVANSGKYYKVVNTVLTEIGDDSANAAEYIKGKVDFKYFQGNFYAVRETDIVRVTSALVFDYSWWDTTMSKDALQSMPHPTEIVEDTWYIADGNSIHTFDGTTAVASQFSLPPGYTITALKIHPDGRYLKVFATDTYNYFHADKVASKMYLLDTVALEFINEYDLTEQVEGAINLGGTCFCTYGDNFGYFDGAGLKPIRKITYSGSGSDPIFSSLLHVFNNTIIFPSINYINAFGDVNGKGNIYFYPFALQSGNFLHYILPVSTTDCLVQYTDTQGARKLARIDFSTSPELNAQMTKIDVGGMVWIRRMDIFMETINVGGYVSIYNRQQDGSIAEAGFVNRELDGGINSKKIYCNILTDFIQPFFLGNLTAKIKKIHIQYESAE